MNYSLAEAEILAGVVRTWALSPSAPQLIIRKLEDGLAVAQFSTKKRLSKGAAAKELDISRSTFSKVENRLGTAPASDGKYDVETVDWMRRQLKMEERRKTPYELRLQEQARRR